MPIRGVIKKFNSSKASSVEDFRNRLEKKVENLEKQLSVSKKAEQENQNLYNDRLSKMDFQGSKKAIERSRYHLTQSLEYEEMIDFLKLIINLTTNLTNDSINTNKKRRIFNETSTLILSEKELRSRSSRKFLLKRFQKILPKPEKDIIPRNIDLNGLKVDSETDRILKEIETKKIGSEDVDAEIEKILREITNKRRH